MDREILFRGMSDTAADLMIANAQIKTLEQQLADARNELCLKCGQYLEAHNGACNGCKWKEKTI